MARRDGVTVIPLSRENRLHRLLIRAAVINALFLALTLAVLSEGGSHHSFGFLAFLLAWTILDGVFLRQYLLERKCSPACIIGEGELRIPRMLMKARSVAIETINELQIRGSCANGFALLGTSTGRSLLLYPKLFETADEYRRFLGLAEQIVHENNRDDANHLSRARIRQSSIPAPRVTLAVASVLMLTFVSEKITDTPGTLAEQLIAMGGLNYAAVMSGEYWRLASAQLLHVSGLHLCLNLFMLCVFGNMLENLLGRQKFLFILLASGVIASMCSVAFADYVVSVGASGAIYGLVGAFVYVRVVHRKALPVTMRVLPGWALSMLMAVDVAVGLLTPIVDFSMHAGGFLTGFLLTMVLGRMAGEDVFALRKPSSPVTILVALFAIGYVIGGIRVFSTAGLW